MKASEYGCWIWAGASSCGYGQLNDGSGKVIKAHRLSWIIHNGEIPVGSGFHGMCVLHKCDNSLCVNPRHLFLGTAKDNSDDMIAKGRKHVAPGELNPMAKLTLREVTEILNDERSTREIAEEYGVHQTNISQIKRGKKWKMAQRRA